MPAVFLLVLAFGVASMEYSTGSPMSQGRALLQYVSGIFILNQTLYAIAFTFYDVRRTAYKYVYHITFEFFFFTSQFCSLKDSVLPPLQPETTDENIGFGIGWLSSFLYLSARIYQVYEVGDCAISVRIINL